MIVKIAIHDINFNKKLPITAFPAAIGSYLFTAHTCVRLAAIFSISIKQILVIGFAACLIVLNAFCIPFLLKHH